MIGSTLIGSNLEIAQKGFLYFRRVTVPNQDSLALGTLRNILRQAGVDLETLLIIWIELLEPALKVERR